MTYRAGTFNRDYGSRVRFEMSQRQAGHLIVLTCRAPGCDASLIDAREDAVYCSARCRARAWRGYRRQGGTR